MISVRKHGLAQFDLCAFMVFFDAVMKVSVIVWFAHDAPKECNSYMFWYHSGVY